MKRAILAAISVTVNSGLAFGSGYQVSLQGQKQIGMGHTGTGLAWDASSIFFNPGALGFLKTRGNVIAGMSFISNKVAFRGISPRDTSYTNQSPVSTPFMAYASYRLNSIPLAFGLGLYTPYGSSVKWPSGADNRFLLQELTLQAICVQPTLSYNLSERVGVGAGFTYAFGGVNLERGIPVAGPEGFGRAELDGKASGIGYNLGLFLKPTDRLSIGANYRSKIEMEVKEGDVSLTNLSSGVPASSFPASRKTTFTAALPLPAVASIGLGFTATENLTLAADFNYTFWSAYKNLTFKYAEPIGGSMESISPRNYENSFAVRVGLDYKVMAPLSVRAGAYYDQTPVQPGYMTLETPDADRIGLSFGLGIRPIENLHLDASLLFINGIEREQSESDVQGAGTAKDVLPGTYLIRAVIPGISVGFDF